MYFLSVSLIFFCIILFIISLFRSAVFAHFLLVSDQFLICGFCFCVIFSESGTRYVCLQIWLPLRCFTSHLSPSLKWEVKDWISTLIPLISPRLRHFLHNADHVIIMLLSEDTLNTHRKEVVFRSLQNLSTGNGSYWKEWTLESNWHHWMQLPVFLSQLMSPLMPSIFSVHEHHLPCA